MIVGTAGFSWSGSSAVSDLLKEYDSVQVYDDMELLIAYHPDGLEDLDYHLNTNCSKFLSSCVAIPRFRWISNYLFYKPTKGKSKIITEEYIKKITQVRWDGLAQGQILVHNRWIFEHLGRRFTYKLLRRLPPQLCKKIKLYPISTIEFSVCPKNFEEATIEYTESILKALGLDTNGIVVLDQPFSGNDPAKSLKYFRDSKAIIVDRDPRELYVLSKEYFPNTSYQIPYDNVEDFIDYYINMHSTLSRSIGNNDVLYIHFEELVYCYEATRRKIETFLGLPENKNPKSIFVPEKSMVNTRLFNKCKKYISDIEAIEKKIPEYLFDFDSYKDLFDLEDKCQGMFDDNPIILNNKRAK